MNLLPLIFVSLTLLVITHVHIVHTQDAQVVNARVDRVVDLTSQLVRVTSKIIVDNSGNKKPLESYLFTFDESHRAHLSFVSASIDKKALVVSKVDDKLWKCDLSGSNAIPAGTANSAAIEIEAVFTHLQQPFPDTILQSERQLVLYNGNHYLLSPYSTKVQTTKVKLPSGSLESFSKLKPSSHADQTITYGPYENVAANSASEMKIHVENNTPFLSITKLSRAIELSHWGGVISVEEIIDVRHTGATLKGAFSRYEFQREPTNGISSVKSWKTKLPPTARDIYYRDDIGNISTSNVRFQTNNVIAELRPRFPLFGGWKTHYTLGYYMPTEGYLFNEGNEFALKIPFIGHIVDNVVIDEVTVKIILPEGSSDIKLRLPYSVNRDRDQIHYTYLDTVGRTVIVLHKTNLVEQHIQDLEVHYVYHKIFMLQEPLLVLTAVFLLCILVIIYVRLDFSISKNPLKHTAGKISGAVDLIRSQHDKRASIYEQFDKAIGKYKMNKDNTTFQATLKRLNNEHRQETQATSDLVAKLKQDGAPSDFIEKVNEIIRVDRNLKEQMNQHVLLVEKLIGGKINKQLFLESETGIHKKKEEAVHKLTSVINSLH